MPNSLTGLYLILGATIFLTNRDCKSIFVTNRKITVPILKACLPSIGDNVRQRSCINIGLSDSVGGFYKGSYLRRRDQFAINKIKNMRYSCFCSNTQTISFYFRSFINRPIALKRFKFIQCLFIFSCLGDLYADALFLVSRCINTAICLDLTGLIKWQKLSWWYGWRGWIESFTGFGPYSLWGLKISG